MIKNQILGENMKELLNINNRVSNRKWNQKKLRNFEIIILFSLNPSEL